MNLLDLQGIMCLSICTVGTSADPNAAVHRMSAGAPRRGIAIPAGGTVLLNHAYSTIKVRGAERRRCAAHAGGLQPRPTTSQADSAHPLHAV